MEKTDISITLQYKTMDTPRDAAHSFRKATDWNPLFPQNSCATDPLYIPSYCILFISVFQYLCEKKVCLFLFRKPVNEKAKRLHHKIQSFLLCFTETNPTSGSRLRDSSALQKIPKPTCLYKISQLAKLPTVAFRPFFIRKNTLTNAFI